MTEKIIPIADHRRPRTVPTVPQEREAATGLLTDQLARPLRDLRISITDRCNFRCVYCMPAETFGKDYSFLPKTSLLSFEEIVRIAKIFVAHGATKIRLTGGEPLLRKNVEQLIVMLRSLKARDGCALDLALTTNGSLLAKKARALKDAGLNRVTVSLDSIDDATFKRINDVGFSAGQVLQGIEAAHQAGLGPVKINMVVKRGLNDHEIVPMAQHFKGSPHIVRFIEYMDVGASNGWQMSEVVPSSEVVHRINAAFPLQEVAPGHTGETAARWHYRDGSGEIGVISSVTQAFCRDCTRARLSTEGMLYTCLFASRGHDLRTLLRGEYTDEEISNAVAHLWRARDDRYSEIRTKNTSGPGETVKKVEMSYIGG